MTLDDSSSSDDDDLLLLSAPIFGNSKRNSRRNQREKACENKAFNYLDTMVKKGEQRMEQQTRIQDLHQQEMRRMEEEHFDQESNGEDKNDIEERNENEKKEVKKGSAVGVLQDERGAQNTNDITSNIYDNVNNSNINKGGSGKKNSEKRYDDDGETKTKKLKVTSHNHNSNNNSSGSNGKKINFMNNEEYWSKLQAMKEDSSFSSKERDRRMKNLRDAVDGLDTLRYDGDNIESDEGRGSSYVDTDGGLTFTNDEDREERMASMGLVTGKSSFVGTRSLFFGKNHTVSSQDDNDESGDNKFRRGKFTLFQNLEEAMKELESIIQSMDKAGPRSLSQSNKKLWNSMRIQMIEPIKKAVDLDLLPLILEKRKEWGKEEKSSRKRNRSDNNDHDDYDNSLLIPFILVRWLIRTSLSGGIVGTELHIGSKEMICRVLKSKNLVMLDIESMRENCPDEEIVMDYVFHIDDLISILQLEFGLWVEEGNPPPLPTLQSNQEAERNKSFGNESGLRHALEIWSVAFERNLVTCDGDCATSCAKQSWKQSEKCICAVTAIAVGILCRSGIDPSFHCGHRLLQVQGYLLSQIFDWIQEKFKTQCADVNNFDKWVEHTAKLSVKLCSGLSTGIIPRGEIKSDDKGWLPLLLAVRTCQTIDQTKETLISFFAYFSCYAARLCIGSVTTDWDSKVQKNVQVILKERNGNESSSSLSNDLRIECVVTSELILDSIQRLGNEITRDGPRFLAAVDIAAHCEQMGIALFNMNVQNIKNAVSIYENVIEAGIMSDHFERLENLCNSLKKRVLSVLVDKNMMRVKELLSLMCGIYRDYKNKASKLAGKRESMFSTQTHMDIFMKGEDSQDKEDVQ